MGAEQCTQYYHCVNGAVTPEINPLLPCPDGTLFDDNIQICNWANQVNCGTVGEVTSCPPSFTGLVAAKECSAFWSCHAGKAVGITSCPTGTLFNSSLQICDWAYNVSCGTRRRFLRKHAV